MKIGLWTTIRWLLSQWDNIRVLVEHLPNLILKAENIGGVGGAEKFRIVKEAIMKMIPDAYDHMVNLAIELTLSVLKWKGAIK